MAASDLIWIDGFDMITGSTSGNYPLSQRYILDGSPGTVTGRFGGQAASSVNGSSAFAGAFSAISQLSQGFAYRIASLPSLSSQIEIVRWTTAGAIQCMLALNPDGSITAGRQDVTTNAIATSPAGVVLGNTWCYIEVEIEISDTVGVFKVYVNGVLVINQTNVDTKGQSATTVDGFRFFPNSNFSRQMDVDDLYITSVAARLGECRVDTLRPNADTAEKDFTPSTGTSNSALIDEQPANTDTDYVSASVVGSLDLYDFPDLTSVPATVHAIQAVVIARKDEVGTKEIRSKAKSGATTADGATHALTTSYAAYRHMFKTDPDTGLGWTGSAANLAQLGFEIVT